MNQYHVRMYNRKENYFDTMTIFAANAVCAKQIAVERLYEEWDNPEDWCLDNPQKIN